MKKIVIKRIIIIIVFMTIFSLFSNVKALYNSSAGTSFNANYTGSCTSKNCYSNSFNNTNSMIVQARLYYVETKTFEQIGQTVYFTNSIAYNSLPKDELKVIYLSSLNSCTNYDCAKTAIKNYFGTSTTTNGIKLLNEISGVDDYKEILTKESNSAKGYRMMLEPAKVYLKPSFSTDKVALITAKGLASEALRIDDKSKSSCEYSYKGNCIPECIKGSCNNPLIGNNSGATSFIVDVADGGIEAKTVAACSSISLAQLADTNIGCGYSLINISFYFKDKTCYTQSIDEINIGCTKSDENNVYKLKEKYTKSSNCSNTNNNITKYGKLITSSTESACKIYCTESAELSLPGNILSAKIRGSYFAWPTKKEDKNGIYPMSMKSTLTCKIIDTGGKGDFVSATQVRKCSSGYTEIDANTCRSNNPTKDASCPTGFVSDGATKNTCTKTINTKDKICPSGTKADSKGVCRKISSYKCSNGTYDSVYKTCKSAKVNENYCSDGTLYDNNTKCYKYNRAVATYGCPSNHILEGTLCYTSRPINFYCNNSNHTLDGSQCYYSSELENIYNYENRNGGCRPGWTEVSRSCTGSGGSLTCNYRCRKWSHSRRHCPSGGTVIPDNIYKCVYNAGWTQLACPSGYESAASSSADYDHACYKDATPKTYKACPSGWSNPGNTKSWCYRTADTRKVCPSGFTTDLGNGYCGNKNYIGDPIYNGAVVDKVCQSGYTEKNGKCYKYQTVNKTCSTGEKLISGKCYKVIEKTKLEYSCPTGYIIDGTTCKKICNIDTLKGNAIGELNNSKAAAKLTGGTNNLFNDYLSNKSPDIIEKVNSSDPTIFTFTKTTNFYIPSHINRYQNILTGSVLSQANEGFLDRKEGVISTSINDSLNQKYKLMISDIKLGVGNKFGAKIKGTYACSYKLTDYSENDTGSPCTCPSGTDNAGDKISDLVELCDNPEAKNYKYTCAELQHILCNKTEPKNSPFVCKKQYTCRGNKNVDITTCVENERKKGKSLEKAIIECTEQNDKCNGNYCYNDKNELQDLTSCLDSGNSKITCMKKYGCSGNSCLGVCTESTLKSESVTLTYSKCKNEKNTTICSPSFACKDLNMKVSSSAEECISTKLNMSLSDALNSSVDSNKIISAMNSCKNSICIPKNSPMVVYRIIDLKNPFPLNNQKSSTLNISFDNNKSRNPGSNWNGNTLINNEILNAREKSNYDLYNSEPLYKITLTPEIIKKIKQSNKSYTYGNFICNDNSLCISNFLHSELKIEAKNDCKNLGTNSTREEYNSCYNSKE